MGLLYEEDGEWALARWPQTRWSEATWG
jgi:hypothetical protein